MSRVNYIHPPTPARNPPRGRTLGLPSARRFAPRRARFARALVFVALAAPTTAFAQPPDAGAPAADGGVAPGDGGVQQGTVQQGTVQQGTVPWQGASDVQSGTSAPPPPSFLDTTDRRIEDERPPPTEQQVRALREMEAEVDRFTTIATSYRDTVISLVRREYLRQRRTRDQWYARQIAEEERLQNLARERAIRLFEQFIARYPDDPTYTPDAMFRLGELYFEKSAIQFQQAYEAFQAARDGGDESAVSPGDTPDFTPTITLYQRLVSTFPDYRRIDGVYYLIGYCLNEMGRQAEARLAWLNLVCANNFTYDPEQFAAEQAAAAEAAAGEDAEGEEGEEHPALTMDEPVTPTEPGAPFVDPYATCQPVTPEAEFVSETWFRIGEYHFDDYGGQDSLDLAISAYNRILQDPEDRNYNLALYKVAWAYYRASRYPEAIRHFGMLVQWSDDERERTGRAGSELRPEAIQYLAISFAYDDWNENQAPDPLEGGPTGIQRIQDPNLLPQDREWTAEVYFALGNIYFDENKLPEAIEVWQLALRRWPMSPRAPEITNMIARAYTRHQRMEDAINYRAQLGDYGEGSAWWNANVENPGAQRNAEQLAENALIGTAVHYHQDAQRLRRLCVENEDPSLCQGAETAYGLAARAYREYLRRYPNNPQAYELRYNLADALFWSGNYEEAAEQYALVRDSNLDDGHLSESARRVVESLKAILDREVDAGRMTVRTEAPEPAGTPPTVTPLAMPDLVQRLAQARELYIARVPESMDREGVRAAYDYNNTLLLYHYGYWPQAKERFERIFTERCTGPNANETGNVAWLSLNNMAVAFNDTAEVARLSGELQQRACTFSPTGERVAVDCSDPENRNNAFCLAETQLTGIEFQTAVELYDQAEASTDPAERRRLFEQSATLLVRAVNEHPNHPQSPIALEKAALALEQTSRFESAARLFQRIVDEVGPQRSDNPGRQAELDAITANAYFRLAYNANRFFDFERAVQSYSVLADSPRFRDSSDENIKRWREDALINAAIIFEGLQQYDRAADYYRRAAASMTDTEAKRNADYRVAEMSFKQRNWRGAIGAMQDFIRRYQSQRGAGELVVQAYWRIAQAQKEQRARESTYEGALNDVVTAFARSGAEPGSMAAEYAAQSKFILADDQIGAFERFTISTGRPRTLDQYIQNIVNSIQEGSARAQTIVTGYEPVTGYRRPTWTIAAYVRQGRAYEILARAVLNTQFVVPSDLQRQMARLPQDARDEIRFEIEGRLRETLDQRVRPIECFAVARYALAARAGRAGALDNEFTRIAVDRLQAYGDERIAECIAEAQRNDPSFQAYTAGEFSRAPRGQTRSIPAGAAPPPLVPLEGR